MTAAPGTGVETEGEVFRIIDDGAAGLGLALDATQIDQLVAYLKLIERWNGTYNLTAVRELRAMATQHVVDCLAVIPPMRARGVGGDGGVLDVGSGAGLPGVVIAIVERRAKVLCVDSVGKKAAFITQAAAELGLDNLAGHHGRVQVLKPPPTFGLIVSRAFASLPDFVAASRHLLAPGGVWMAMKGKLPAEELAQGAAQGVRFHVEPLGVPGLAAERCLIWAELIEGSKR